MTMNLSCQSSSGILPAGTVVHNELLQFKIPSGVPKRKVKKVLNEETYTEEIGKIIQRDFFPDLEKLKAQTTYLEAVEANDVKKLKELFEKYSGRRPLTERITSPATFETPVIVRNYQDQSENIGDGKELEESENENEKPKEKRFTLDQYLNSHTSQDNQSFQEMLVESIQKNIQKYSYLYNNEEASEDRLKNLLALPSIEEQAKPVEKKLNIDTWGYKNRNYIMFNPDGVQLTAEQEMEINRKRQEIMHENTRLVVNPFNETQSKEAINELAKVQAKVLDGKIGVDGKEILKSDTPQVGGFSFVRSPSPAPGVLGTPLMTWGEIEGTPFRLDGSDTPLPRTPGPSFKMSEPPRREQLALALAEKVGEKNRDQKKKNINAQKRQFSSPSPRPNSSVVERLATMSPAAKKLATSSLKLGVTSESSTVSTPSPKTTPVIRSPRTVTPLVKKKQPEVSTDDLLKINLPKRQRAQDFFHL